MNPSICIYSLITLEFVPWCSSSFKSSLAIVMSKFCWSISNAYNSSLAIVKCFPCSGWYARICVFDLTFSIILMLLAHCWFSPYDLKMLMIDFKLFVSQFGSSDMLAEFCLWIWKIGLWIQTLHQILVLVSKLFLVGMGCAWIWGEIGRSSLINV
jgi:hypothetical protein